MRRTLILGGTAWLGREIATQLLASGNAVTCLARGSSGSAPVGATLEAIDRSDPEAYDRVKQQEWDDVIELSYDQGFVTGALRALASQAAHWTLVSSVSVYSSNAEPHADETAEVVVAVNLSDYGHAKVAAEKVSTEVDRGFTRRSNAAFISAGGVLRSLDDTLTGSLEYEQRCGLDRERRSGLSRHDELALLEILSR